MTLNDKGHAPSAKQLKEMIEKLNEMQFLFFVDLVKKAGLPI